MKAFSSYAAPSSYIYPLAKNALNSLSNFDNCLNNAAASSSSDLKCREKSRIAAQTRRNFENSALLQLHRALPIHALTLLDHSAIEKSNLIRIASHSLYLYNNLHPYIGFSNAPTLPLSSLTPSNSLSVGMGAITARKNSLLFAGGESLSASLSNQSVSPSPSLSSPSACITSGSLSASPLISLLLNEQNQIVFCSPNLDLRRSTSKQWSQILGCNQSELLYFVNSFSDSTFTSSSTTSTSSGMPIVSASSSIASSSACSPTAVKVGDLLCLRNFSFASPASANLHSGTDFTAASSSSIASSLSSPPSSSASFSSLSPFGFITSSASGSSFSTAGESGGVKQHHPQHRSRDPPPNPIIPPHSRAHTHAHAHAHSQFVSRLQLANQNGSSISNWSVAQHKHQQQRVSQKASHSSSGSSTADGGAAGGAANWGAAGLCTVWAANEIETSTPFVTSSAATANGRRRQNLDDNNNNRENDGIARFACKFDYIDDVDSALEDEDDDVISCSTTSPQCTAVVSRTNRTAPIGGGGIPGRERFRLVLLKPISAHQTSALHAHTNTHSSGSTNHGQVAPFSLAPFYSAAMKPSSSSSSSSNHRLINRNNSAANRNNSAAFDRLRLAELYTRFDSLMFTVNCHFLINSVSGTSRAIGSSIGNGRTADYATSPPLHMTSSAAIGVKVQRNQQQQQLQEVEEEGGVDERMCRSGDLIGQNWLDLVHLQDLDKVLRVIHKMSGSLAEWTPIYRTRTSCSSRRSSAAQYFWVQSLISAHSLLPNPLSSASSSSSSSNSSCFSVLQFNIRPDLLNPSRPIRSSAAAFAASTRRANQKRRRRRSSSASLSLSNSPPSSSSASAAAARQHHHHNEDDDVTHNKRRIGWSGSTNQMQQHNRAIASSSSSTLLQQKQNQIALCPTPKRVKTINSITQSSSSQSIVTMTPSPQSQIKLIAQSQQQQSQHQLQQPIKLIKCEASQKFVIIQPIRIQQKAQLIRNPQIVKIEALQPQQKPIRNDGMMIASSSFPASFSLNNNSVDQKQEDQITSLTPSSLSAEDHLLTNQNLNLLDSLENTPANELADIAQGMTQFLATPTHPLGHTKLEEELDDDLLLQTPNRCDVTSSPMTQQHQQLTTFDDLDYITPTLQQLSEQLMITSSPPSPDSMMLQSHSNSLSQSPIAYNSNYAIEDCHSDEQLSGGQIEQDEQLLALSFL